MTTLTLLISTLAIVTALSPLAGELHAQTPDTSVAGQRIKLVLAADTVQGHPRQMLFGRLERKTADSLGIDLGAGIPTLAVPRRTVDAIFVSRGVPTRKQSATGGAIGGAVVGAGIGLLLMLVTDANFLDLLGHVTFDAAAGAAVGALMPQESWRRVSK